MRLLTPLHRLLCTAVVAVTMSITVACSGSGGQGNVLFPSGNVAGTSATTAVANTTVKVYVPAGGQVSTLPTRLASPSPLPVAATSQSMLPQVGGTPAAPNPTPAPGSQLLSIDVSGPTTINQVVSVGPNSPNCAPSSGGTTCQLSLSMPVGAYVGTISGAAVAFTVSPGSNNVVNLTLGGVPAQVAVVPGSSMSAQNAQGGIDLYGAGRHLLVVELLDANQNVIVGAGATFSLSQSGGSLPLTIAAASTGLSNAFYLTAAPAPATSVATVRVSQSSFGLTNPCAQSATVCSGSLRIDVKQILAVANAGANSVTLYLSGASSPLVTIQNGVSDPQALVFDSAGDLFVANQPGSVSEYVPPYNQAPLVITSGINRPRSLAIDAHANLFVANGSGSNTVTVYAPPYEGPPAVTIASNVDDPVDLVLDPSGDLFVVNAAGNSVTQYSPPYGGAPTVISKGLNAPSSAALDGHGDLFVANLNSTPNSIVEYVPPFSGASTPIATITNGINEQGSIAMISANLFVPNEGANTVTQYSAPYTGTPTTIVGGQSQPVALAIDAAGNLYVANYGNNTVTEYASPYAPGAWTTISTGVNAPVALALSPGTSGGPTLLP